MPSTDVFLVSPGTPGLGFDTVEQKQAWGAGRVTLAPSAATGTMGASVITFPDGKTLPVEVMDAQAALDAQLPSSGGECDGVPADKCQLTITAGTLSTAQVLTTAGQATVPVWSFRAEGLSKPIVVVAVSTKQLPPEPAQPAGPPNLPQTGPGFTGVDKVTAGAAGSLVAWLTLGACDTQVRGHVVEFDDMVVVGGTFTPPAADTICNAMLRVEPTTLSLTRPLADRVVVSASDGSVLRVHPAETAGAH